MGHLRNFANRYLPKRLSKTIGFYKAFPKKKEEFIHQFLQRDALAYLTNYPPFQEGQVPLLGKAFKFSHANSLIHSVEEVFCDDIYAFNAETQAPYILDCGANIGVSVLYFKRMYPKARLVAFEPDAAIFQLLKANTESNSLADVTLENKAVWNKTEELTFFQEGALAGSLTTDFNRQDNTTVVAAVDLLPYLTEPVDYLKIDIEGAEFMVLKHIAPALANVKNLFIEYHSDKDTPQQLHNLLSIVSKAGFRYYVKEAANLTPNPFMQKPRNAFDLQLNIFCYR